MNVLLFFAITVGFIVLTIGAVAGIALFIALRKNRRGPYHHNSYPDGSSPMPHAHYSDSTLGEPGSYKEIDGPDGFDGIGDSGGDGGCGGGDGGGGGGGD